MRILFVADVIGSPGRRAVRGLLRLVRGRVGADAVILNGENSAGGFGITPEIAREFFELGVDVITTGNHVWDKQEILPYLDQEPRLLRPANYPAGNPGSGSIVLTVRENEADNRSTRAAFARLLIVLMESEEVRPAVATHDPRLIALTLDLAQRRSGGYEFQMLYGIRRDLQEQLVKQGYPVRVYVPFGSHWYPYFMRRLAERPANIWFFISNFFRK